MVYQEYLNDPDNELSDEYDSEYSDLQEAKDELEELKDSQENEEKADDENYLDDGIEKPEQDGAQPEGSQTEVREKKENKKQLVDQKEARKRVRQKFIHYYQSGSFYSKSSSSIFYKLSS